MLTNLRLNAPANAAYLQQPAFGPRSLAKVPVQLGRYRGKVVLLDFWETSCAPCIGSILHVQRLQDDHPGELVVLGILLDTNPADTERAKGILRRQRARYLNLVGTPAVAKAYRTDGFPRYYVIGKDGNVAATHTGGGNLEELTAAVQAALAQ